MSGKVVSAAWDAKADKGRIVVQPRDAQAAQVTVDTDKNTKVQVLRMWSALVPYDVDIQKHFESNREAGQLGRAGRGAVLSHASGEVGRQVSVS